MLGLASTDSLQQWQFAKQQLEITKKKVGNTLHSGYKIRIKDHLNELYNSFLYLRDPEKNQEILIAMARHYYFGSGSYGKVKASIDESGNKYALKILPHPITETEQIILQNLGYLYFVGRRTRAIKTYDNMMKREIREKHYLLIKLFDGINLDIYLNQYTFDQNQKRKIACEVLNAVSYLHERPDGIKIIHADLKPDNFIIYLGENGEIKIAAVDFNGSKFLKYQKRHFGKFTNNNDAIGAPLYRAPETFRVPAIHSEKSDIFSLGKIFEIDLKLDENKLIEDMCADDPEARPTIDFILCVLNSSSGIKLPKPIADKNKLIRYYNFVLEAINKNPPEENEKIFLLNELKRIVRLTANIDELHAFTLHLEAVEKKTPRLTKEADFLRSKTGKTTSWKNALDIIKQRTLELGKEEARINGKISVANLDLYNEILGKHRGRLGLLFEPTRQLEFTKFVKQAHQQYVQHLDTIPNPSPILK